MRKLVPSASAEAPIEQLLKVAASLLSLIMRVVIPSAEPQLWNRVSVFGGCGLVWLKMQFLTSLK